MIEFKTKIVKRKQIDLNGRHIEREGFKVPSFDCQHFTGEIRQGVSGRLAQRKILRQVESKIADLFLAKFWFIDELPDCVIVENQGFLDKVTIS